jgi:hypothetical protein
MALTAHKSRKIKDPDDIKVRNMNVAASTVIYNGAIVAIDGSGDVTPAPASQATQVVGIARNGFDNSASLTATTDRPLVVEIGQVELFEFDAAIDDTDVGSAVWYVDDEQVSTTNPATIAGAQIGTLLRVEATPNGWVDTSKAVS